MDFPVVASKEDFLSFVVELRRNFVAYPEQWQSTTVPDFLGSLAAWVEDGDAAGTPESWRLLARALFAGSRYE